MPGIKKELRFFTLETDDVGVTLITFNRPPVNALSREAYQDLCDLADVIESDDSTRAAVFVSPHDARAWCGGGDLNDLNKMTYETRIERYALITKTYRRIFNLDRPIIAAVNNHAIGAGFFISTLCDFRIVSNTAFFALPEIERGVLASSGFFFRLGMPQGILREMIFTGRRYTAEELRPTNIFNQITPKEEVLPRALELARIIAKKSLPALKANKAALNVAETQTDWLDTFMMIQKTSAELTAGADSKEGIRAFLEKRSPIYVDK